MARTPSTEPRTFLGHPLTPQPQPMDRRGRARAVARIEANDEAVADPNVLAHLIEANRVLFEHVSRPAHKRILWSGLAQLDNTGVWSDRAGGGLASRSIWVYSPNVPIIVAAGTRQAFPPNSGPGVFLVPAAVELTLNAHTPQWTIYGNGTAGGLSNASPVPAPGANPTYTTTAEMTLETVTVLFTTSVTAGNRYPALVIRDPSGQLIEQVPGLPSAFVANTPYQITWGSGLISEAQIPATVTAPLTTVTLAPGSTISLATNGLLAGDQYSALVVSGSGESLGPASSSAGALVNVTVYSDTQQNR